MNPSVEMKKILIVGAGAVGGYFGARLFRAGVDVTFLVRPLTFEAISQNGLSIQSVQGDFIIHPPLIQNPSEIDAVDLILLTVKCPDVAPLLPELAPLVKKGAVILTLQNGVSTEDQMRSFYQQDCVIAGVAFITARLIKPGVIEHARRGIISLGEISGEKSPRATKVYDLINNAGISCRLTSQIQKAKWEKLCWNATFNPLSVILAHPISLILESSHLTQVVRDGIAEVVAVAAAEGFDLNPKIIDETISVSSDFKDYYTSMYEDYRHGKGTEIEYLNGEVVRRGKKHGLATPVHHMLYALIKGLEMKNKTKVGTQ